jgi:hypothetical protein
VLGLTAYTVETPAQKWPDAFNKVPLFVKYPYLLPCAVAASITLIGIFICQIAPSMRVNQPLLGSILGCFLGRDGGPREGAIQLAPEKVDMHPPIPEEESVPPSPTFSEPERPKFAGSIGKSIGQKVSGYFSRKRKDTPDQAGSSVSVPQPPVPLGSPGRDRRISRAYSRTSALNGSAYGYGSPANRVGDIGSMRTRRSSEANTLRRRRDARESQATDSSDMNFAQRLLMANENAVTNIADLWVAAAMNVDYDEDPFIDSDDEVEGEEGDGDARDGLQPSDSDMTITPRRPSNTSTVPPGSHFGHRRMSREPSIFSHAGVRTPAAVLDAQDLLLSRSDTEPGIFAEDNRSPIQQRRSSRRRSSLALPVVGILQEEEEEEKQPSLWSQLPILVIVQYGFLALHTTTHDQVFMSYLVR